jgi:chemotaxis protein MotA
MDLLTILGLLLGGVAVIGGSAAEGGIATLWNSAAFMIVIIGTAGAITVQTPLRIFMHALKIAPWVLFPPKSAPEEGIEKIIAWSKIARKEGVLGLESLAENEPDPFARKGLQLLVDGSEPETIRNILGVEISNREQLDAQGAKVFKGMGMYAPMLGIIGTFIGFMAVLQNLTDPSKIGPGIAGALVAAIYGIALASLLFLPMAAKLKNAIREQTMVRELVIEGLIAIAEGENPRNIETKLQSYRH